MAAVPPQIPGLVGWRPLARGGFATVWEAKQLSLNRLVAVKVDKRTLDSDTEQRRFLREAGAAGRMSGHPGIVTVHDAGILTDNRPYLVMALCEGGSLTKWVKGEPRPSEEEVREVGVRIADALAATHARGVLHRDVKPANILIDSYGNAGLADFGLAALPDPGMELSETLEAITPAYAPPEVFYRRPPTAAGDVYSLGATLYAVLSGRPPHWPESGTPNVVDIFERLDDPIDRIPGVDEALMDALLAALAADPADRPTAAEFRDRLSALSLAGPAGNGPSAAQPIAGREGHSPTGAALATATATATAPGEPSLDTEFETGPSGSSVSGSPETLGEDTGSGRHQSRRRTGILVAAVAVLLAVALTVVLANLLPDQASVAPGSAPSPTAPVSPAASPSPEETADPTPTGEPSATGEPGTLPASFQDCSELGSQVYCTPEPECWGSVRSYADAPRLSEPADCNEVHLYQTFAAAPLNFVPRRQSSLNTVPLVKKVCDPAVVNSMLVDQGERRDDWEVYALPPQDDDENYFRCIFGRGERTTPIALQKP